MKVRLFIKEILQTGNVVSLDKDQSHYLKSVLRLKTGSVIFVFNSKDGEFEAAIFEEKIKILNQTRAPASPLFKMNLVFAVPKNDACASILKDCTQVGVFAFYPVTTHHGVIRNFNEKRAEKIVMEATEQSDRLSLPIIKPLQSLSNFLSSIPENIKLIFCDEKSRAWPTLSLNKTLIEQEVFILVGPEGGFSSDERNLIIASKNTLPISLGPNILRAETACVCACFLLNSYTLHSTQ